MKRARIHDVAEAAGVHASTVSRVMNPRRRHLVSPAVAHRVEAVARRLGYSPDPLAAGLRGRGSRTVGVVVPDLANPLFPLILRGIESALGDAGYIAIIANTDNDPDRAQRALAEMSARRVEGLIFATARRDDPLIADWVARKVPVVLINRGVEGQRLPAVLTDDVAGIGAAVDHLHALGHRRIGHVGGPASLSTGHARRAGFVAAMKARGLGARPPVATAERYGIAAGLAACRRLLDSHSSLTAVVAANDLLALGCYDALRERGLACPRDVSVTGFNDMAFCERFDPPLTTVRVPQRRMGEEAVRLLLAALSSPGAEPEVIRLTPTLVVRASTAAPRRRAGS